MYFPRNHWNFFSCNLRLIVYGVDADEEIGSGKNEDEQHDGVSRVVGQFIKYEFVSIRAK